MRGSKRGGVMGYRYDCSYPFLDVALRYDIPYEKVLEAATFLDERGPRNLSTDEVVILEEEVPLDAMQEIAALVDLPVAERGGRHES
jgi:hypothetical protein